MRAAERRVCFRASNWQSQRETRRSLIISIGAPGPAETVTQPLPPHKGQTSGGAWGNEGLISEALFIETRLTEILFTQTFHDGSQRSIRLCTADPTSRKS